MSERESIRDEASSSAPRVEDRPERILFVTGRLAEPLVRRIVAEVGSRAGFCGEVCALGISVAALMHADWIARRLQIEGPVDRVLLPGWCQGDLACLAAQFGVPFERGPKDIRDLPAHFGHRNVPPAELDDWDIEILAEINHAPRLTPAELLRWARHYQESGADVIDVGTEPGASWSGVGDAVRHLRDEGFRVSIDSFDRAEVEAAVAAGAELVLSGHSRNRDWLSQLPAEVVVIPDEPHDLASLESTVSFLREQGRPFRIDPVLEPIGFGFAASLGRYFEVRRRWPEARLLMGIGNVTELTDVDSAGVNVLLAGLCQELGIQSVLTTEVINWARSAVREFDRARRLVHHAVTHRTLPKHVDTSLVMLRDPQVESYGEEWLGELAAQLTDRNFRVFAEQGEIHIMNREGYWRGRDPFEVFERLSADTSPPDAAHAFYLGYELCKATTAQTLGKQYRQDEALRWGFLTVPESSAHERRRLRKADDDAGPDAP